MTLYRDGLIAYTAGSVLDPFPRSISIVYTPVVSGDGLQVAFLHRYQALPTNKYGLYIGYLVGECFIRQAPDIEAVAYDRDFLYRGDHTTPIRLAVRITDTDGQKDIDRVETSELAKGRLKYVGCFWNRKLRDDGEDPDIKASDKAFSTQGKSTSKADALTTLRVRISACYKSGNVGMMDMELPVIGF